MQGYENLTAKRVAELLWAIGWEPYFEARKIPDGENENPPTDIIINDAMYGSLPDEKFMSIQSGDSSSESSVAIMTPA